MFEIVKKVASLKICLFYVKVSVYLVLLYVQEVVINLIYYLTIQNGALLLGQIVWSTILIKVHNILEDFQGT